MDLKKWGSKLSCIQKKYRLLILVLLIGILFMMLPSLYSDHKDEIPIEVEQKQQISGDISQELTQILTSIQGVGKVQVMLTIATGQETIYHTDSHITSTENGSSIQKDTVIITGSDRNQEALVSVVKPPTYLGAIIVCQGADQPSVKLSIVDAVSKITGLSSDKISVVKMK